jgi:hypothetical protein
MWLIIFTVKSRKYFQAYLCHANNKFLSVEHEATLPLRSVKQGLVKLQGSNSLTRFTCSARI